MAVKAEYHDRDQVEVEVLIALADRAEDGMSVLEVRAAVDANIDRLEVALSDLKDASLIRVEQEGERVVLYPADHVIAGPDDHETEEAGLVESLRQRIGF